MCSALNKFLVLKVCFLIIFNNWRRGHSCTLYHSILVRIYLSFVKPAIDLNFLPLSYWHEYLDMLLFYKTNCCIMRISESVLPKPKISRITRSLDENSQKFQIRKCKTSTYQQTYTIRIRTTRIWNILPRLSITNKFTSLTTLSGIY